MTLNRIHAKFFFFYVLLRALLKYTPMAGRPDLKQHA
jgi:hypothetical protein